LNELAGETIFRIFQSQRYSPAFIESLLAAIQASLEEAITQQKILRTSKTRVETPVKARVKTEDEILVLLSTHAELSLADVAATIGRSVSAVERAAAKLKTQNRLAYEGPKKGGKWKVIG